jgi:aminomethyltransferase
MAENEINGFFRAPDPAVLILRGDDAGEFLNGQVSNDVAALADGQSRYALLLTPKGKLRADMVIARDGDETLIVCSQAHLPKIRKTIDTYRIGYFFSTEDANGQYALIHLLGEAALCAAELAVPAVELDSPLGRDLLVTTADLPALLGELTESGLVELDQSAFDAARVTSGVPLFGSELDEDTFPAEAGLERRAISFEKGCYVGQETVARMHYKGRPNRHLRQLRAAVPLASGALVTAEDGRELGTVGTTAAGKEGASLALAILRREGEPGAVVDVDGEPATIVEISEAPGP